MIEDQTETAQTETAQSQTLQNRSHSTVYSLPRQFKVSGFHCGIKSKREDIAIFVCDKNCTASGVYTTNVVRAANIDRNRILTPSPNMRAVVINSGNANACTGAQGVEDTETMAKIVATELSIDADQDRFD